MSIPFEKIHACGNDFLLLESPIEVVQVRAMCDRNHGLGADGVMLYRGLTDNIVRLDHYDCDGSRSFCLNGIRAGLACLLEKGLVKARGLIESEGVRASYENADGIAVALQPARYHHLEWTGHGHSVTGFSADAGNPHYIVMESNVPPEALAPLIRHDTLTFPNGANVNFPVHRNGDLWEIRTFERGVEGFTKACGSGVVAVASMLIGEGRGSSFRFEPEGNGWISARQTGDTLTISGPTGWVASGIWRC